MNSFAHGRHPEQNSPTKWFYHYLDSLWLHSQLQLTMKICRALWNSNKQFQAIEFRLEFSDNTNEWHGCHTYSFSSRLGGDKVLSLSCSLRKIVTRATVCFVFSDSNETFHWSVVAVAPKILTPDFARALSKCKIVWLFGSLPLYPAIYHKCRVQVYRLFTSLRI